MHGHEEDNRQQHDAEHRGGNHSPEQGACAAAAPTTPAATKPTHKRSKSKSKVWEKVAWFTRKSRSREVPSEGDAVADPDLAALPMDVMELDLVPSESSTDPYPLNSSNTSSDSEPFEDLNYDGCHIKRSRLYPNSEVVEQNCLRPSMARALFHQIELANGRAWKQPKYSWQKKKKYSSAMGRRDSFHSGGLSVNEADPLARALSVPSEITENSMCHCMACCSCLPSQRLMGACPAYARLSMSTTSLDTGLDLTVDVDQCSYTVSNNDKNTPTTSKATDQQEHKSKTMIENQFVLDLTQYKSNSLPSSYGKKCKYCNKIQAPKTHLPFMERDSQYRPIAIASTSKENGNLYCQCKLKTKKMCQNEEPDIAVKPDKSPISQDVVNPIMFKSRREEFRKWFSEFNDEQKNLILKDMLSECDLPQLHLLSLSLEPRLHEGCPPNCQDLLTWLPQSTAVQILSLLDPVSLCRASGVCRSWYNLANDPGLWRRFSCQAKWRLSPAGEQKQLIQHMLPNGNIHWKQVFSERYRLRHNWLKGKCNVRTFEGHTQGISCVQFDDTRIVSGSSDKTIKVWNIRTNTPWSVQTLVGHSGTVRCLHLEGNRLVSGSTDKSIKVWDLSTQQSWSSIACKVTMIGHTDTVRCLQVDDEKVISGSYDCRLKIWDIRKGQCRLTLRGHDAAVLCVQFDDSKIVSGSCDKTIKVWTFDGACIMTLHGHHDAVTCLQFDATLIVSGSLDCNLKFWDLHSGKCNNTIDWKASEGHTGVVRCLQADSWRVVSASDDRTLKVWSLETGQRLVTLRNHTDGVTCLQFNDSIIVSGSYDKTVKLWDFSSC